jgi:hypothetical protein
MSLFLRIVVALAGLSGFFYVIKLFHDGRYRTAIIFLILHTLATAVFLISHLWFGDLINGFEARNRRRQWWL